MNGLTGNAVRQIERIHLSWIESEIAGETQRLLALCSDDIEFWPPDAPPALGRSAVSALLKRDFKIDRIEISDRRIRGSDEFAYLTATFETTFSFPNDSAPKRAHGTHLWVLRKQGGHWLVALVSWSLWR